VSQLESAVVYDGLPISSGGAHALNRLTPREAFAAWLSFLQTCTHVTRVEATFKVDNHPGPSADRRVVRTIKDAFPEQHEPFSQLYPVPASRLEDAVEVFEQICPLPTDEWGNAPVWLHMDAHVEMRQPDGGPWPGQDPALFGHFQTPSGVGLGASSIRLILSGRLAMGLTLTLPEATDDDIARLRPWLHSQLPFRMSSKHWVRWSLNKNGRTYRAKRLDIA